MIGCITQANLLLTALVLFAFTIDASPTVQETESEFIALADLDGDGLQDAVLVDKATGRIRPGYRRAGGLFNWVEWRDSSAPGTTGLSVGRFFGKGHDGLALASQDGNLVMLLEAKTPTTVSAAIDVPFMLLGPNVVAAMDIDTKEDTGLQGLFVGSVYNSPDENVGSLFLNTEGTMKPLTDLALPGTPRQANRVRLATGGPEFLSVLYQSAQGTVLAIHSYTNKQLVDIASVGGLAPQTSHAWAKVRGLPQNDLLLWEPGSETLTVQPVVQPGNGRYEFGEAASHNLQLPIRSALALSGDGPDQLFVIHGDGTTAGLYTFGSQGRPGLVQTLQAPTNHVFNGAVPVENGFVVFQGFANGGSSVRYQFYTHKEGLCEEGTYGRLPTLADNDKLTIGDIHARIVEQHDDLIATHMRSYTNTIPGTKVTYSMVVIPGGEFVMGSPATEAGRKPDEGPQHKVVLDPFWMGQCEVTWNEFELFMYPDQEKRMREVNPSEEAADTLADAVTHPSKPYADMTFGMGREGYPAIAMTQHAANKYCQWLSAKTGHFYRLPTEAEWEYATRAGTSTAYFFGDDDSALGDYAWYEMNSDFKYQKVGRKQPNPWGLHDVYGNVVEWVLDQYDPESYAAHTHMDRVENPWNKATQPYPHSVRGGSWDDSAEACRSGARRGSDAAWKLQDPQLPKSAWYFTDADFVGFRIVRPLAIPSAETLQAYWNSGVERE